MTSLVCEDMCEGKVNKGPTNYSLPLAILFKPSPPHPLFPDPHLSDNTQSAEPSLFTKPSRLPTLTFLFHYGGPALVHAGRLNWRTGPLGLIGHTSRSLGFLKHTQLHSLAKESYCTPSLWICGCVLHTLRYVLKYVQGCWLKGGIMLIHYRIINGLTHT